MEATAQLSKRGYFPGTQPYRTPLRSVMKGREKSIKQRVDDLIRKNTIKLHDTIEKINTWPNIETQENHSIYNEFIEYTATTCEELCDDIYKDTLDPRMIMLALDHVKSKSSVHFMYIEEYKVYYSQVPHIPAIDLQDDMVYWIFRAVEENQQYQDAIDKLHEEEPDRCWIYGMLKTFNLRTALTLLFERNCHLSMSTQDVLQEVFNSVGSSQENRRDWNTLVYLIRKMGFQGRTEWGGWDLCYKYGMIDTIYALHEQQPN